MPPGNTVSSRSANYLAIVIYGIGTTVISSIESSEIGIIAVACFVKEASSPIAGTIVSPANNLAVIIDGISYTLISAQSSKVDNRVVCKCRGIDDKNDCQRRTK